jgi:hypothetical protein
MRGDIIMIVLVVIEVILVIVGAILLGRYPHDYNNVTAGAVLLALGLILPAYGIIVGIGALFVGCISCTRERQAKKQIMAMANANESAGAVVLQEGI